MASKKQLKKQIEYLRKDIERQALLDYIRQVETDISNRLRVVESKVFNDTNNN